MQFWEERDKGFTYNWMSLWQARNRWRDAELTNEQTGNWTTKSSQLTVPVTFGATKIMYSVGGESWNVKLKALAMVRTGGGEKSSSMKLNGLSTWLFRVVFPHLGKTGVWLPGCRRLSVCISTIELAKYYKTAALYACDTISSPPLQPSCRYSITFNHI